jgi:hypothetical protein
MRKSAQKGDGSLTLNCFSPLATLITFVIEMSFAIYAVFRYRQTRFGGLVALLLICLAGFQVAEYRLCGGASLTAWSQIAFFCITLLPPLGIHLASMITRPTRWVPISYVPAAIFEGIILLMPSLFVRVHCTGRFVIFSTSGIFLSVYGAYYVTFLAVGVGLLLHAYRKRYGQRESVAWLLAAYASFIVPTGFLYSFFQNTRAGISSIMCGFAIVFALIMVTKILPNYRPQVR